MSFEQYKSTAVELLKDPDSAEHISNQLAFLMQSGARTPAHLALAKRAASLAPNEFVPVFNLGSAQVRAGQYWEGLDTLSRALTLAPESYKAKTQSEIALAWYDLGEFKKAIEVYDRIQLDADQDIKQARCLAALAAGDLANGLYGFECEFYRPPRKPIAQSGIPRWMGEDLTNKSIIVHHEQGYGDTIQFSRFMPHVRAGRVAFAGPPELVCLLRQNFQVEEWLGEEGPFKADYYCSPMSAAGALRVKYPDISGEPYLTSDARKLPDRGKLKVGLSWCGSPSYAQDANRSMKLEDLAPLWEIPGAAFYSLQVGSKDITRLGLDGFIADLTPAIRDWNDTARAIMAMDVVVAVDTAVAHLAGALGKVTYVLLPYACCWRWMRGRDDTPWYRSAKLFRQSIPCDWTEPVLRVQKAIRERI